MRSTRSTPTTLLTLVQKGFQKLQRRWRSSNVLRPTAFRFWKCRWPECPHSHEDVGARIIQVADPILVWDGINLSVLVFYPQIPMAEVDKYLLEDGIDCCIHLLIIRWLWLTTSHINPAEEKKACHLHRASFIIYLWSNLFVIETWDYQNWSDQTSSATTINHLLYLLF